MSSSIARKELPVVSIIGNRVGHPQEYGFIGSGILAYFQDRLVILTALHVARMVYTRDLIIGAGHGNAFPLKNTPICSVEEKDLEECFDGIDPDFAIIPIPDSQVKAIKESTYIIPEKSFSFIFNQGGEFSLYKHLLLGYPISINDPLITKESICSNLISCTSRAITISPPFPRGFSPHIKAAFDFDMTTMVDNNFQNIKAFDHNGMSGGLCVSVRNDVFEAVAHKKGGDLNITDFIGDLMQSTERCFSCAVITHWSPTAKALVGTYCHTILKWSRYIDFSLVIDECEKKLPNIKNDINPLPPCYG